MKIAERAECIVFVWRRVRFVVLILLRYNHFTSYRFQRNTNKNIIFIIIPITAAWEIGL